jgi:FixJ family two-component response regulator
VRQDRSELQFIEDKLARLTPREREVLEHVIDGKMNKQIAVALGTVEKTVKVHRGRMMAKLGIRSVADLVRLAGRAGIKARH